MSKKNEVPANKQSHLERQFECRIGSTGERCVNQAVKMPKRRFSRTGTKLTVQQAAEKVIDAMQKADYNEDDTHEVFNGLFFGKAWESYELYCAIKEAFKEGK